MTARRRGRRPLGALGGTDVVVGGGFDRVIVVLERHTMSWALLALLGWRIVQRQEERFREVSRL